MQLGIDVDTSLAPALHPQRGASEAGRRWGARRRLTCLVGGVGVEHTPAGPAYGIEWPGQIRAWGYTEIRRGETPSSPRRRSAS